MTSQAVHNMSPRELADYYNKLRALPVSTDTGEPPQSEVAE
ncbi:cytochrome c oxidase assembly protein Cox11 [Bradyrhizobium sp. USDA 3240]